MGAMSKRPQRASYRAFKLLGYPTIAPPLRASPRPLRGALWLYLIWGGRLWGVNHASGAAQGLSLDDKK